MEWLWTGFILVIRFVELLNYFTLRIPVTRLSVFSVTVFTALLGNGFQRQTVPSLWILDLSSAWATATINWRPANTLWTLSRFSTRNLLWLYSSEWLTPRLAAISHQPPTLPTAVSGLASDGSWPSLYSFGTDLTENASSNSSSFVACVSVATTT
jgi:hypothetical protein